MGGKFVLSDPVTPVPLPEHYVLGFDEQTFEMNPGVEGYHFTAYLRGEVSTSGWWYYFLYALLVKSTPGAALLLIGAVLAFGLARRSRLDGICEAFLLLPPLAMLASMSFLTDINLGLRYALICFPYSMVWIGRLGRLSDARPVALMVAAGIAIHGLSTFAVAPNFMAYFSPIVGGTARGHEHLLDSNLDWGQDLLELRKVLDRRGHRGAIPATLWTNMDPVHAGLELGLVPIDPRAMRRAQGSVVRDRDEPDRLVPGLVAMSLNYVMGLPGRRIMRDRPVVFPPGAFSYFQKLEPVDRAGRSIWLYELSQEDCDRLNAELGLPEMP